MGHGYVPLFWRLFVPNATVLGVACVVLFLEPANGRVVALAGGLVVMLAVNFVLIRRAVSPLVQLTRLMDAVDPLSPGKRLDVPGPPSEITVLGEAFNGMLDRLEAERRESGRRALTEREAERRRLAGELHDEIGQSLTATVLQVERLRRALAADHADEALEIRSGVEATLEDVRRLARDLRPEALDGLGLVPALTNLIERVSQRTGLRVTRQLARDLPPLSPEAELVIFRVTQESLTNALRHAGAGCVDVTLRVDGPRVHLAVRDDGQGLGEPPPGASGIRTMRERALSVGADLRVGARADGPGTEVRLELDSRGS